MNGGEEKILNGRWVTAVKTAVTVLGILVIPSGAWIIAQERWKTAVEHKLLQQMNDRFSAGMFIEVQDELSERNPELHWLTAKDVREIQMRGIKLLKQGE